MKSKIKYPKALMMIILCVVAIYGVFSFTISETLELNNKIALTEEEILEFNHVKRTKNENPTMFNYNELVTENSENIQQEVLHLINADKKSLLNKMFEIEEVKGDDFTIQIQPVMLQGSFFDLLKTLNRIETDATHLHVSSVNFFRRKNRKTKREELYMKIYVQKIV